MGKLTTHVLDTAAGKPAAGVAIELYGIAVGARLLLVRATTNADGRCDAPLLADYKLRSDLSIRLRKSIDSLGAQRIAHQIRGLIRGLS